MLVCCLYFGFNSFLANHSMSVSMLDVSFLLGGSFWAIMCVYNKLLHNLIKFSSVVSCSQTYVCICQLQYTADPGSSLSWPCGFLPSDLTTPRILGLALHTLLHQQAPFHKDTILAGRAF